MDESFETLLKKKQSMCKFCTANFKLIRKLLKMNQWDIAAAVGTTQRHISEIENGKAKVSWTLLLALSTVLVTNPQIWQNEQFAVLTDEKDIYAEGKEAFISLLRKMLNFVYK